MNLKDKGAELWHRVNSVTYRVLMLGSIAMAFGIAILQGFLGGAWGPLLLAALPIGVIFVLVSFVMAAILAFPGWLIRGSFDLKPLTLAFLVATHSYYLTGQIFEPLMILPQLKWVVGFIQVPLAVVAAFVFYWALLMTSLPHRWSGGLTQTAFVLSLLAGLGTISMVVKSEPSAFVKKTFEDLSPGLARTLGGPSVSTQELSSEILYNHRD